jgi:hypothetical protein
MNENKALERILEQLADSDPLQLSSRLPLSDLNTWLLEVFRQRTQAASAVDLLKAYSANRFVLPSELDPLALKRLELDVLTLAADASYQPLQLSPVAPLGSCSIVATSDQNKVISALRGTEVVADATNLIALHICKLLKERKLANDGELIRFCTTHRHVRAQSFGKPGLLPHFHLYCMVTSGKDQGSYSFERRALLEHVNVYRQIFEALFHTGLTLRLNRRDGYTDSSGLVERMTRHIQEEAPDITVIENPEETRNQYYKGLQFSILVQLDGQEINIGDGGFVDWPQKLLGSKKERMLISAIGLERLVPLRKLTNAAKA